MSEDLVKRLRKGLPFDDGPLGRKPSAGKACALLNEAADEIEELREAMRLAVKAIARVAAEIQSELPA